MHKYCMKVRNTSFFLLWMHVIAFFVRFACSGNCRATTSNPVGSSILSHFSVTMCGNALMKLYSLLLITMNVPSYLVLEMMSLSSVQFVIMILHEPPFS